MLLEQWKADTERILTPKMDLTLDDYREFLELCMFFLGCQQSITFKQPVAFHKARWMSKLLYSIKTALMQDQIEQLPQECGVKLSSDFLPAAHSEKHYQNVLQVVWQDRKKTRNLRSVN